MYTTKAPKPVCVENNAMLFRKVILNLDFLHSQNWFSFPAELTNILLNSNRILLSNQENPYANNDWMWGNKSQALIPQLSTQSMSHHYLCSSPREGRLNVNRTFLVRVWWTNKIKSLMFLVLLQLLDMHITTLCNLRFLSISFFLLYMYYQFQNSDRRSFITRTRKRPFSKLIPEVVHLSFTHEGLELTHII
jgi:hypothetical protein